MTHAGDDALLLEAAGRQMLIALGVASAALSWQARQRKNLTIAYYKRMQFYYEYIRFISCSNFLFVSQNSAIRAQSDSGYEQKWIGSGVLAANICALCHRMRMGNPSAIR